MIPFFIVVALIAPKPRVPAYVPASDALGQNLTPKPERRDGGVWYAESTHLRLSTLLKMVEPGSDARAREAWGFGWIDAREHGDKALSVERRARYRAEANSLGLGWVLGAAAVAGTLGVLGGLAL